MPIEIVTPPSEEPVSLAEATLHCHVDNDAEDAWFTNCITAARQLCEVLCGRAFVTQTLRLWLDEFPAGCTTGRRQVGIMLPRPKLVSVSNVKYIDTAGTLQTMSASDYKVDAVSEPGLIMPAYGKSWPSARDEINSVQVEYVAGWGAAAAVDARAKQSILLIVSHWYENREAVLTGTISKETEFAVRTLMGSLWHGELEV